MDMEIQKVEEQIKEVDLQIKDAVRQAMVAAIQTEVAYWRSIEKQLREDKKQLRDQRLLLLEDKNHLRELLLIKAKADTSATMPWAEWVLQTMPQIQYAYGSGSSSHVVKDSVIPNEEKKWDI